MKWTWLIGLITLTSIIVFICAAGSAVWFWQELEAKGLAPVELYTLRLELYKTIITGILVALLVLLIPLIIQAYRDNFEQRKEARQAYSEAKTSISYLTDVTQTQLPSTIFQV